MKINFISQILSFGVAFFINIFILKNFDVKDYGEYSLLNTIIMFGTMAFSLNIQEYLNIGLNKYQNYSLKQNFFFNTVNTFMIGINVIIAIILFLCSSYISRLVNISPELVYIVIIIIFVNIVFSNHLRYQVANANWLSYNIFLFTKNYAWFIIFFLVGTTIKDIFYYMLLLLLILTLIYYFYFEKQYNFKQYFYLDSKICYDSFSFGIHSFFSTISFFVILNSDKIMISIFSSNKEVGLYSFAVVPFSIIWMLFQSTILTTFNPKINKLFHKSKKIRFLIYKKLIFLIIILFSPIYLIFFF